MKKHRWFPLFALLLLLPSLASGSEPRVTRPSLRLGYAMRFQRQSWAVFTCQLENPSERGRRISMQLVPRGGFSKRNIFTEEITIPAKTVVDYRSEVMIEDSEDYQVLVFVDGSRQTGAGEDVVLRLLPIRSTQVAILNDEHDISLGGFVQLPKFKEAEFSVVSFTAESFPDTWQPLRNVAVVAVLNPDFNRLSPRQYRSLLDYVSQGGIIVFANPRILADLAATPWGDLLPAWPAQIRMVESIPELEKLVGPLSSSTENGFAFLEAVPREHGVSLASLGEYPAARWMKYGLGSVRFSAIPLNRESFGDAGTDAWGELLGVFFGHQELYAEPDMVSAALDEMTGFAIPPVELVQTIFLGYFIVFGLALAIGYASKRQGLAWAAATLVAAVLTLAVLRKAAAASREKGKMLTGLEFSVLAPGMAGPVEGYYSFFSDVNLDVDINVADYDSQLAAIPADAFSFGFAAMAANRAQGGTEIATASHLDVNRLDGMPRLSQLKLMSNAVRQFASMAVGAPNADADFAPPVLSHGSSGFALREWKPPASMEIERAFLMLPSGSFNLALGGGGISLDSQASAGVFQGEGLAAGLMDAINHAYKKTSPALVLVSPLEKTVPLPPSGVSTHGKRLLVVPLVEELAAAEVLLPPEMIVLTPADTSTRMAMSGNRLKSQIELRGASSLSFNFRAPPVFAHVAAEEIVVRVSYANPGGNIELLPELQVGANKIKGGQSSAGVFVFDGADIAKALKDGVGTLQVAARERNPGMPESQKLRANRWWLNEIQISVRGTMPSNMIPFSY